ncbi:MAG: hypothetical protein VKJ02_06890 [Snowella sp.]|nr:hypothetical protein [Snowella sp.]
MLEITSTFNFQSFTVNQPAQPSLEAMELERLIKKNHLFRAEILDPESKQQIIQSLLIRTRQMSRIRRLSARQLRNRAFV